MQYRTIFKVLGVFLMLFSFTMLPPLIVAQIYHEGHELPFTLAFGLSVGIGVLFWLPNLKVHRDFKIRDGFLIVVLFWTVLSLFGALPFMLAPLPHDNFTDAVFESVSGLTTTGASVLSGLDHMSHAIRFYRQELQFLGGMGIIILALAILPMLGIGGMQLYRAEMPGPNKDHKLTPRITETAKALWMIYVGLTVLCASAYWLAGMAPFDAIGESLSTIATGGFTLHDASFAFYQSESIKTVAIVFMILGGCSFSLHFLCFSRRSLKHYWLDQECRTYFAILFFVTVITAVVLIITRSYSNDHKTLLEAAFAAASMVSTTGFVASPFALWPSFLPYLLVICGLIGGCAASTSGGIKVIRMLLLQKQGAREIQRLIHPNAVLPIKLGKQILSDQLVHAIWGFIAIFITLFVALFLLLLATGLSASTALSAEAAMITNVGAGVGSIAHGYDHLNLSAKWILIATMLLGRLEIFTVLVLFSPAFWRR